MRRENVVASGLHLDLVRAGFELSELKLTLDVGLKGARRLGVATERDGCAGDRSLGAGDHYRAGQPRMGWLFFHHLRRCMKRVAIQNARSHRAFATLCRIERQLERRVTSGVVEPVADWLRDLGVRDMTGFVDVESQDDFGLEPRLQRLFGKNSWLEVNELWRCYRRRAGR